MQTAFYSPLFSLLAVLYISQHPTGRCNLVGRNRPVAVARTDIVTDESSGVVLRGALIPDAPTDEVELTIVLAEKFLGALATDFLHEQVCAAPHISEREVRKSGTAASHIQIVKSLRGIPEHQLRLGKAENRSGIAKNLVVVRIACAAHVRTPELVAEPRGARGGHPVP